MRQDVVDLAQTAIWDGIGEEVEVFAPSANVALDAPIWTGSAIRMVPDATDAPGDGLSYQLPIHGFSFRLGGAPELKQGTIVRYASTSYTVAEIREAGSDTIRVAVNPA